MRATVWGCRGSLATPGPATARIGGNTSCLELRPSDGRLVVVDAGTGIRPLGLALPEAGPRHIDLLLTHLHLDHIEGLGFFAPLFDPECTITIWGPHQPGSSLAEQLELYLSPPFSPLRFGELPARIEVNEVSNDRWQLGALEVQSAPVRHPGSTVGYRFEDGGSALAYIPDNEPALEPASGRVLAVGADVLLHDAQYTQDEYARRAGWGHCSLQDLARFAQDAAPDRLLMFHHDPEHDDRALEEMRERCEDLAGRAVELAAEGLEIDV